MFKPNDSLNDRYQLQQQLGNLVRGRQAWLAFDPVSREYVVIKLLAFIPQMEWGELELFEREARILQSLNHPRIPRYRDYFDLDREVGYGVPWFALVQSYIRGDSLQDLLDRGKRFTESEVTDIAKSVLEILTYLHGLNPPVLHRDIKPSNLILGHDDRKIYLVDFGAVQDKATVTGMTFTVVGTSGYAPIEQFYGRAVAASDLYALGATLIHLLTRVQPMDLPRKNSQIQFTNLVSVSSSLVDWLHHLTSLDVESRPQSAKDALNRLNHLNSKSIVSSTHNLTKIEPLEINKSSKKFEFCLNTDHFYDFYSIQPFLKSYFYIISTTVFITWLLFCTANSIIFITLPVTFIILVLIHGYIYDILIKKFSTRVFGRQVKTQKVTFYCIELSVESIIKELSVESIIKEIDMESGKIKNSHSDHQIFRRYDDSSFDIKVIHDGSASYYLKIKTNKFTWTSPYWNKSDLDFLVKEIKNWLKEKEH